MTPKRTFLLVLIMLPSNALAGDRSQLLTTDQLDAVAAGDASVVASAITDGTFGTTTAHTGAVALRTPGRTHNQEGYGFAAGGHVSGVTDGTFTGGVAASTGSGAPNTNTISINWSHQNLIGSAAAASSHTVGNTGTFFGP